MEAGKFTMTKEMQVAADFGKVYFENGYSRQILYSVFYDGKLIKQIRSTKFDEKLFAFIILGNKAVGGVEIVPAVEIVYEVRFSVNKNKKITFGTRVIVIEAN